MASAYAFREIVENSYLGEVKEIKANSSWELQVKIDAQEEKWAKREALQRERDRISDLKSDAEDMDTDIKEDIEEYNTILLSSLAQNNVLDWKTQKNNKNYPSFTFDSKEPSLADIQTALKIPQQSFWEIIFNSKKLKRESLEKQSQEQYDSELQNYNTLKEDAHQLWEQNRQIYLDERRAHNGAVDEWKEQFEQGLPDAIEKYLDVVFAASNYPESFSGDYTIQYDPNSHICIVSMDLPNTDDVPNIIGYKYVASSKSIKPLEMKAKDFTVFYDSIIKQTALRTIKEVFSSDYPQNIQSVVFNGWVTGVNKANGQDFTSCIISIQVSREKFEELNLERVSISDCIRDLKAVYAGNLAQLAPVKPILELSREDHRFIESREVLANMNSESNLATMPWEDFEHLVRELFAKYFSENGSEVKVTQSSRDGGVDAIAFDPDPIRGGKFVIQAKRYNRVVPVSAVRDLYGTMINEGAAKGILVTTSYYGNDSREFVKDKPISLIDGSNLIHMFSEYGYDVHIELKSASE